MKFSLKEKIEYVLQYNRGDVIKTPDGAKYRDSFMSSLRRWAKRYNEEGETGLRRKNKTCGSYNGAEITGDIFSLVRSAIINGLDPRKYFEYCLEHYDDTPAEELVPYYSLLGKSFRRFR